MHCEATKNLFQCGAFVICHRWNVATLEPLLIILYYYLQYKIIIRIKKLVFPLIEHGENAHYIQLKRRRNKRYELKTQNKEKLFKLILSTKLIREFGTK